MDHKLGAIWSLDPFITVEIQFWPSNQHGRDLGRQIMLERGPIFRKQSPKNRQYISNKSTINWRHRQFFIKIADLSCFDNISPIFWQFFAEKRPSNLS